ncbi:MAG: NUDIX domain-containing protein [Clostridia bacterium]|nr:NUDIX domain-containing protein [Clostridia bacterium]
MNYEKSCGAIVFRKADQWNVLLIRHIKGKHISFPKGHMEAGETESQTAAREVFEETGIRVKIDRGFRAENRYRIRSDTQKLVVIFTAVTQTDELTPQPEEIAEAFWLPVAAAFERLTYERDRKILRDACRYVGVPDPAEEE